MDSDPYHSVRTTVMSIQMGIEAEGTKLAEWPVRILM